MKTTIIIILFVMLIVLLFAVLYIVHHRNPLPTPSPDKKVFQFNAKFDNFNDSDMPSSPFNEVFKENNISVVSSFDEANIILFSDYSFIDQRIDSVPFRKDMKYYIFGIRGSDAFASKSNLASHMKKAGMDQYIPKSYVLYEKADIEQMQQNHVDGAIYMVKKNLQRQEGNLITKDFDFILNSAAGEDYVVCQELLSNPYIVGGRKINMRIYLLILTYNDKAMFFIYNNGFMYYTPKMFEKGSTDRDVNITTGYIDRKVYEENPLTIQDLYKQLGDEKSEVLKSSIMETLGAFKKTYEDEIIKSNTSIPGIKFNIFGVDIAPDESLKTTIMEVNKGPDLSYKDDRDKAVKLNMVFDCFAMVKLSKERGNAKNFIKLS